MKPLLTITFILLVQLSHAQSGNYPVIGQPMPEFELTDVHYFNEKVVNNNTAKGKWLILDFWNKGCVACVQSFPKLNALQSEFKDNVQFMLVGSNDKKYNKNIDVAYDKYRNRMSLTLPIAYDSIIFKTFGVQGVPHIIVIDPDRKVYAVTWGDFLTRENINALVAGQNPKFTTLYNKFQTRPAGVEPLWKYLIRDGETPDEQILYRSLLSKYAGESTAGSSPVIDRFADRGYFQITRASLTDLYNLAYIGSSDWMMAHPLYTEYSKRPLLLVNDSSLFANSLYNYSLVIPKEKATKEFLMAMMQSELQRNFGYSVTVETRSVPCWKLTATEDAKRKLKSTAPHSFQLEPTGLTGKRITIENILGALANYNADERAFPFFDETNIRDPIDVSFTAIMTDMDDVIRALKKHGLILSKGTRELNVIVIRDPLPAGS